MPPITVAADDRISTIALSRVAEELAATPLARHAVRRGFPERWYQRIAIAPTHEAWLIGWGAGHELELHDHGDSSGALAVVTGRLTEQSVDPRGTGLRRRVLRPGGTHVFDTGHIHHVANEHDEPAVSVHVYSPRLRSMTFYDHHPDNFLQPLRSEVTW